MADRPTRWPAPSVGDVVWCRFPEALTKPAPAPKSRPGIIVRAFAPHAEGEPYTVHVCPGTSQLKGLYDHELLIDRNQAEEFAAAGLSYPTKFDLKRIAALPYTSDWFIPPPNPRFGAIPRLGTLHPSSVVRMQACYKAGQR